MAFNILQPFLSTESQPGIPESQSRQEAHTQLGPVPHCSGNWGGASAGVKIHHIEGNQDCQSISSTKDEELVQCLPPQLPSVEEDTSANDEDALPLHLGAWQRTKGSKESGCPSWAPTREGSSSLPPGFQTEGSEGCQSLQVASEGSDSWPLGAPGDGSDSSWELKNMKVKNTFIHVDVDEEDGLPDGHPDAMKKSQSMPSHLGRIATRPSLIGTGSMPTGSLTASAVRVGPAGLDAEEERRASPSSPAEIGNREPSWSVGAQFHGTGMCKPCSWYYKPAGCQNGEDCRHCHMCPCNEIKMRRKRKSGQRRTTKDPGQPSLLSPLSSQQRQQQQPPVLPR